MSNIDELAKILLNLKVSEVIELKKILSEKYGIVYNNNINSNRFNNVKNSSDISINDNKTKKSNYDIVLTSIGGSKLSVIKLIKEITGLTLLESKKYTDSIPTVIKKGVSIVVANDIKEQFSKIGAVIEMK